MSPIAGFFSSIGRLGLLTMRSTAYFPSVLVRSDSRHDLMRQLYATGVRTLPVLLVVSLFTGMILALQVGLELRRFNQEEFLGAAVMITLIREMAPFTCGICLAACVGSAIAAELGTMKVNEEVDALRIMGISPNRYLVAPRVFALVLMAPLLSYFCCILGTIGGGVVGSTQLGVDFAQYVASALSMAGLKDFLVGTMKALSFGLLIGVISAKEGLDTELGAMGVGKSTQKSVINSFLAILVMGYIITRICYQ